MAGTISISKEKQAEELICEDYKTAMAENNQQQRNFSLEKYTFSDKNEVEIRSVTRFQDASDEQESAIFSLVQSIRSHEMNFFDEASAISKLIRFHGLTQEDAAQKLGRAQSTVANKLRLLRLTDNERDLILLNKLTERHARSLLKLASAEDRMLILNKIIKNNLNVEHTEHMIESFIGKQKEHNCYKKRSRLFQNVNGFISTINKAVESMQANGILANSRKIRGENYIEFRVRIDIKQ